MSATAANLTADLTNITNDQTAVRADLVARKAAADNLRVAIVADLKVLDTTKAIKLANNKLAATLNLQGTVNHLRIVAAETTFLVTAHSLSAIGVAEGKALLKNPTSTGLQKAVNNDIASLESKVSPKLANLNTVVNNAVTLIDQDYTNISTANPSLATVISDGEATVAGDTTTFLTAASKVSTDVSQLVTDLTSIV